jgi:hypothetical protein
MESPRVPFHVVTMLPRGASFNATWFIQQNLVPLSDPFLPNVDDPTHRKLVIHIDIDIDNAPAHKTRVTQHFFQYNPLKKLPHPPYSPDISPSDFYLLSFGESEERADWTRDL